MTKNRLTRIFWMGAAAVVVVAALVALVAVVRGDFSDTDARILGTLAAILLAGSTVVAGLAVLDRGGHVLGWTAIAITVPSFTMLIYAIWDFVFDGGTDHWRWGWTGGLMLLAALVGVTAQLLARTERIIQLAWIAAGLAVIASGVSILAIWRESPGDTIGRTLAVLWIITALAYFLVPVLQRFTSAGSLERAERVLAVLDDVELVATYAREGAVESRLEPGERLLLRRRA